MSPQQQPNAEPSPGTPAARAPQRLSEDARTLKKLDINYRRNKQQDHTSLLDQAAKDFSWEAAREHLWCPEDFALMHGTPLWDQATADQRRVLNQLYWVAYYSQIISAEIATIFFNQTSAAGLYGVEDFRVVCDTLDLESTQERAHINAFKTVSEATEQALFGERVFTYPMRTPFAETMIFTDTGPLRAWWKRLQLRTYTLLSSGNAFIACQYFTVRGVRTLSGKLIQHQLSAAHTKHPTPEASALPAKISYYHFMDESYHFNSSNIISHDILRCLPAPTPFERQVANMTLAGCQKEHGRFSIAVRGIFWHDPALFGAVEKVLRSPTFGLGQREARELMRRCFCEDNDAVQAAAATHKTALDSYQQYLSDLEYVSAHNKELRTMRKASVEAYLATNRRAFARYASA